MIRRWGTGSRIQLPGRFNIDERRPVSGCLRHPPGTTKLNRLEENIGGASVALTADDLREIGDALAGIQLVGERYPAAIAHRQGR